MAENPRPQIGGAVVRVDHNPGERIVGDRVDGKIAAGGGLGVGERRIGLDRKAAVTPPGFRFATRKTEIVVGAGGVTTNLDDAEAAAHDIGGAERRESVVQRFEIYTADLDIEIMGHFAQQPIPHAAADQSRPTDPPGGVEQGAKFVGDEKSAGHFDGGASVLKPAATTQAHPIINESPPKGAADAPSQLGAAFRAKR